jgi:hypothetical protein
MKIEDVKNLPRREMRTCRANLRLYPSQMKFLEEHDLSVQAIFDKALDELGHVAPKPEEVEQIEQEYRNRISKRHGRGGKGNVMEQRRRWRKRQRRY